VRSLASSVPDFTAVWNINSKTFSASQATVGCLVDTGGPDGYTMVNNRRQSPCGPETLLHATPYVELLL
jgi:hypothetical protein